MPFLGIDQSLTATGLCLLSSGGVPFELSTVDPGDALGGKRLVKIKNAIVAMCRSVDWKVDFAALEGYSMGSINRPFDLGEVGGVVRMVLADNDIPYIVVPPVILKVFATGTTGATKDRMVKAAEALGAEPHDDNEADAFFLARLAHAYQAGTASKRCEMDAIHMLKNPKTKVPKRRTRKLVPAAI